MKRKTVQRWAGPAVVLAVLIGSTACGDRRRPGAGSEPPAGEDSVSAPAGTPVVIISIDTLRADRLPMYGYRGVETPALDALRRDSVLFAEAYSHTPLTLPSHATLLTGLLPDASGVRDNVGYLLDRAKVRSGETPHLARLLQAKGYATGGAISAFVLLGKTGIAEGFDVYEDSIEFRTNIGLGGMQRPGGETLDKILPWLRETAGAKKPFFLFFHIYEPHTPYEPAPAFAARYANVPYDGEVASADAVIGSLADELRRLGVYDRSLVVLVSDHGEGLGDHGEDEHGVLLYRESIHVPLLVKLPGAARAGQTVTRPVGLFDVAPTILSALGLPPPPAMKGRSLFVEAAGEAPRRIYAETFYPRLHLGWSELFSLADGRHHFIEGPDPELYDLTADPHQRTNLRSAERRVFGEMRRELDRYDRVLHPPAALDEETRQAMAALGYLGTTVAAVDGPLPDPKTKIGTLRDFREGMRLVSLRDHRAAADHFRRTVTQNPRMADAWEYLGQSLQRLGDLDGAIAAYQQVLKLSAGSTHVAVSLASVFFSQGRIEEAESHARMALATNGSFAHGLLAQIAKERGDLAAAEREARASLEEKGDRVGPMITLAEVLHAQGRYEDALARLGEAEAAWNQRVAKDPDLLRNLELTRGKTFADLGNPAAARAAFATELSRFPDSLRAYASLAILEALLGNGPVAANALKTMVERNPTAPAYVEAVKTYRVLGDAAGAERLLAFALRRFPDSPELSKLRTESGLKAAPASR